MAVIYSQNGVIIRQSFGGAVIGGRIYPTVKIGTQEWISENLDFKFANLAISNSFSGSSKVANYYDEDEITYGISGLKYGMLYNGTALRYIESNTATLIPGWHIPTLADWETLFTAVGGQSTAGLALKAISSWNAGAGTDDYNFAAYAAGLYNGGYTNLGSQTAYWTATQDGSTQNKFILFSSSNSCSVNSSVLGLGFYIRLVRDT